MVQFLFQFLEFNQSGVIITKSWLCTRKMLKIEAIEKKFKIFRSLQVRTCVYAYRTLHAWQTWLKLKRMHAGEFSRICTVVSPPKFDAFSQQKSILKGICAGITWIKRGEQIQAANDDHKQNLYFFNRHFWKQTYATYREIGSEIRRFIVSNFRCCAFLAIPLCHYVVKEILLEVPSNLLKVKVTKQRCMGARQSTANVCLRIS